MQLYIDRPLALSQQTHLKSGTTNIYDRVNFYYVFNTDRKWGCCNQMVMYNVFIGKSFFADQSVQLGRGQIWLRSRRIAKVQPEPSQHGSKAASHNYSCRWSMNGHSNYGIHGYSDRGGRQGTHPWILVHGQE